MIKMPIQRIRI